MAMVWCPSVHPHFQSTSSMSPSQLANFDKISVKHHQAGVRLHKVFGLV